MPLNPTSHVFILGKVCLVTLFFLGRKDRGRKGRGRFCLSLSVSLEGVEKEVLKGSRAEGTRTEGSSV